MREVNRGLVGLPVSMYLDGYKNITSVDFSSACIDMMAGKFADKAELEWKATPAPQHCSPGWRERPRVSK